MKNTYLFGLIGLALLCGFKTSYAAGEGLDVPAGARFVNGTGQIPIVGITMHAPGFTTQGYIEICEDGGPNIYFIGMNGDWTPITIHSSFRNSFDTTVAPTQITYAQRNKKLGLSNPPNETVVQPWQFYVSDPIPVKVKKGDILTLRTFVPLKADTEVGCGIISVSEPKAKTWYYGNVPGPTDRTLDTTLEKSFTPTSDLLCVPFLVCADNVRKDSRFLAVFGDSLTFQLAKDEGGTWFQDIFSDTPHVNLAIGGDALSNVLDASGKLKSPLEEVRFAIAKYATDVINYYGHNDLGNGISVDNMLAIEKAFCARPEIADKPKWVATLTPFTRFKPGVDKAKATNADQFPDKTAPAFDQFNKIIRDHYKDYGYTGVLDFHAALAVTPDSDFWKPGMAGDGTHFGRNANPLLRPEARKVLGEGK